MQIISLSVWQFRALLQFPRSKAAKEAWESRDTAQEQQVVCQETAFQGEPVEDEQLAVFGSGLNKSILEGKQKRCISCDPSWCSYPLSLVSEEICSGPLLFFSFHCLFPTCQPHDCNPAGTVGTDATSKERATPCPGLTQNSQHKSYAQRSDTKVRNLPFIVL